jgi:hypothetical protein
MLIDISTFAAAGIHQHWPLRQAKPPITGEAELSFAVCVIFAQEESLPTN